LTSLRKLGYAQVYTSDRATAPASAWLQPRFSVRSADTLAGVRALFEKPTRLSGAKAHARIAAKRWR